ncbi:hypothetical protein TEQG_00436 [Trichophyton equinum CBS 127.97]|uniref:Small ribosomal subunit protein mS41 n=1 Tax=Trichophyton equinum (strain ATCC MYA-4606 / CBS 127.97) TaxID=559882 RepID=F2PHL5_TRIEC|nr:hypothetical protein TEQG_00436 [Trichophyton equinum CBS 127.97]
MAAARIPGFNARTSLPLRLFTSLTNPHYQPCVRYLHQSRKPATVPSPTPFVPDVETFLRLIGRNMSRYSSKITGWKQLFTGETELKDTSKPLKKFAHYKLHHGNMIKGPYAQIIPNTWSTAVKVQVTDGMWEHKRGRKIDGGQRRQKEIRAKRALAERRNAQAAA